MDLVRFCTTSNVVVVAGKGGVGKTTVVATLATVAARASMSVLVVEVEGKSGLARAFGAPPLGYEEVAVAPGVTARTITPDAALLEYLGDRSLRRISKRLVRSGALEVVATAVPGMREILVLGKVKQLEQEQRFDLIVVDAPAAGHAVGLLVSPRGLVDAVSMGPIRTQAEAVTELLEDPTRCQVMMVTIPEETPVNELVETAFAVEDKGGVTLGPVVVNGCLDRPAFGRDLGTEPLRALASRAGVSLPVDDAEALGRAGTFTLERYELQREQIGRLHDRLPLPQIELPHLVVDTIDPVALDSLVESFVAAVTSLEPGSATDPVLP